MTLINLLLLLQLADILTTLAGLGKGLQEANPLLAPLFAKFGAGPVLIVVKAIAIAALWYFRAMLPFDLLAILCLIYGLLIANNLYLIIKGK